MTAIWPKIVAISPVPRVVVCMAFAPVEQRPSLARQLPWSRMTNEQRADAIAVLQGRSADIRARFNARRREAARA